MKRIATASLILFLAGGVLLAGPDEDYLTIYDHIQKADALEQGHQFQAAAAGYLQAVQDLQKFQKEHPTSNAAAVSYRLDYLMNNKLKEPELLPFLSSTNATPGAVMPPVSVTAQQMTNILQQQILQLTDENAQLRKRLEETAAKLKEALTVQPAAATPGDLEKARQTIMSLEKERDLLQVTLDQLKAAQKAAPKPSASTDADKAAQKEAAELKQKFEDAQKKLSETTTQLNDLKSRSTDADKTAQKEIAGLKKERDEAQKKSNETAAQLNDLKTGQSSQPTGGAELQQLTRERDQLKKRLADVSKELADIEAHGNGGATTPTADLAAKLKAVEAERDDLKKEVAAMVIVTGPGTELERLRARVAVLEATNVPYTAEELALLKAAPTVPVPAPPAGVKELPPSAVVMPAAMKEPSPPAHAAANLSAAAIALLEDGRLDVKAKHYDAAEKKFLEVLHENPNNLFVLCALATVQYDAGHLDDCEKSVRRALERDPDDAGSLYMFGVLRNTQGKLDEALDALSRSAGINSTNAATQFYLGTVLAAKGMRPQAETALRKAVVLEPDYGDAHFALATIYAAETPPMVALARSHYQKALDQHHPKDEKLEKLISGGD